MNARHIATCLMLLALVAPISSAEPRNPPEELEGRGKELEKQFSRLQVGMTSAQVLKLMGAPADKRVRLWSYNGGRAPGEPFPVTYVYRIEFQEGKVSRTERTISDCIIEVPAEER